jgi:hypothetical protein
MKRRRILIIVLLVVVSGVLIYGFVARHRRLTALERLAQEQSVLPVEIIGPKPGLSTRSLSLPGTVRAW